MSENLLHDSKGGRGKGDERRKLDGRRRETKN